MKGSLRPERNPGNTAAHSERKTSAEAAATDPRYERGRIDGASVNRSGNPSPSACDECPAAVVERCESPRQRRQSKSIPTVQQRPNVRNDRAPSRQRLRWDTRRRRSQACHARFRCHPGPRSRSCWARRNGAAGGGANRSSRSIHQRSKSSGGSAARTCIADWSPLPVITSGLLRVDGQSVEGGDFGISAAHRNRSDLLIGIRVDAVDARPQQGDGAIRRIDFVALVVVQMS